VVPLLAKHGGHVNKFLGDGVLAVFGAPVYQPDHADRALSAAKEIVQAANETYGGELGFGIGINSGDVVVGSVGGGGRLEFTLIGDAVNVAARVEQLTKETGDTVLITDATRTMLSKPVDLESRGWAVVRGRADEVRVFALSPTEVALLECDAVGMSREAGAPAKPAP
jgi:class 3 adenylate cyclase